MYKPSRIVSINNHIKEEVDSYIVSECWLTIFVNESRVESLLCSPTQIELLTFGFLYFKGLIGCANDIERIEIKGGKEKEARVYLRNLFHYSSSRISKSFFPSHAADLSSEFIIKLVKDFDNMSNVYRVTHGVHEAAIADRKAILFFYEDIGRYNAIDKVFGRCLLEEIDCRDKVLITSGRINSVVVSKVASMNIPVIISVAVPTDVAIAAAEKLGMTLVGLVHDNSMNIYASHLSRF